MLQSYGCYRVTDVTERHKMSIKDSITLWPQQWAFVCTLCCVLLVVKSCASSGLVLVASLVFTSLFVADLLVKTYDEFFYRRKFLSDRHDKAVMVTGCDSGFGILDSLRLADMGFLVYATVLCPDGDGAQRLKRHKNVVVVRFDVTDQHNVDSVAQYVADDLNDRQKTFWALVNNAGIGDYGDVELIHVDQFAKLMDINVFGVVRMCKAFVPLMRAGGGRIVNMTSQASFVTVPMNVPYCMTKHALMSLNNGLRAELKQWNISVHCISPLFCETFPSRDEHEKVCYGWFMKNWDNAPAEIKAATGLAYYEARAEMLKQFCMKSLTPKEKLYEIVDDVAHAVAGVDPKVHYTPGVYTKVMRRMLSLMPQEIVDLLTSPPPPDVKPLALANRAK